jgi:hypothetical protein
MVVDPQGQPAHAKLGPEWSLTPENPVFRDQVQETVVQPDGTITNRWVARRPIPETDTWFETAWAAFRTGAVYNT